jgi:hypothetical protein
VTLRDHGEGSDKKNVSKI